MKIIDISVPLSTATPIWPGDVPVAMRRTQSIAAGDPANVTILTCSVHSATHVDAPLHFIASGKPVEQLDLDLLVGPAWVCAIEAEIIAAETLEGADLPEGTERLLLHTANSSLWERAGHDFVEDYVALSADAARWIVDQDVRLVGIDYLSIQRFHDPPDTHLILLEAGVTIVEGLDLSGVAPGHYELVCLPLKLSGDCEGAPARAVLIER